MTPARWPIRRIGWTSKKGEQIKVVLRNGGLVDHEFLIDTVANNERHKADMQENPEMAHEGPIGVSEGSFEFACLLPGHYEAGMKGVVAIK